MEEPVVGSRPSKEGSSTPDAAGGLGGSETIIAATIRAIARLRGFARLPRRLPVRVVAKATDRATTLLDAAEALAARGGLRAVLGGGFTSFAVMSGSVMTSLAKATVTGTILFSVFESAMARTDACLAPWSSSFLFLGVAQPFVAGSLAGAVYGCSVVTLDAVTARITPGVPTMPASGRAAWLSIGTECAHAARISAVEWGGAFGCYFLIRRIFVDSTARGSTSSGTADSEAPEKGQDELSSSLFAALAVAAVGGGAAQVSATSLASNGWTLASIRSALRPRPVFVASLGLAAYEFAHYLE